jgi:coenzyme F420-reducing hydrogenase alpha subunit
MSPKMVTINPITRLEGNGKIRIFFNEDENSGRLFSSFELKTLKDFVKEEESKKYE